METFRGDDVPHPMHSLRNEESLRGLSAFVKKGRPKTTVYAATGDQKGSTQVMKGKLLFLVMIPREQDQYIKREC